MYDTRVLRALFIIIRKLRRRKHLRDKISKLSNLKRDSDNLFRFWAWWFLVFRTTKSEGAKLIVKMLPKYNEWKDLVGEDLDEWVFNFAANDGGFTEEFLDILTLGLGPWPTGDD